jgi:hypothetical protein
MEEKQKGETSKTHKGTNSAMQEGKTISFLAWNMPF